MGLVYGLVGVSVGSEPVTVFLEFWLELDGDHLTHCLLQQSLQTSPFYQTRG